MKPTYSDFDRLALCRARQLASPQMGTASGILSATTEVDGVTPRVAIARLPITNFMPPEGEEFRFVNYVTIPAEDGLQHVVVQFKVPQGRNGMINRLANVFVGGGFQEGQGLITWQLWADFTPGIVVPNFDSIVASLGTVYNPAVMNGIRIKENQLVTLTVSNAVAGVVPAGQQIGGLLGGYFYPVDLEPPEIAF